MRADREHWVGHSPGAWAPTLTIIIGKNRGGWALTQDTMVYAPVYLIAHVYEVDNESHSDL